jgi:8-amino-3,8-dideoxy-alpha-D-manno-octulosonate transaminase
MPGFELMGIEEQNEINDVFQNGSILFRRGFDAIRNGCYKVSDFEKAFANQMGVKNALAVSSGTAALRIALAALGIGPGDEVITQSFTFVATVEAIIESRATPICADINTSLNLDPEDLEKKITHKTKAVIVVHMLGVPAQLNEIKKICEKHKLYLIEDTAWGCGGSLNQKPLGTWGDIGTFSFDYAKTITTGEGGMVICNDKSIYDRAAAWHDHGHENNPSVPRWEDTRSSSGFNFRMMELQGAIGLAQLKKLNQIVLAQRENKNAIWNEIFDLKGIEPRFIPEGSFETADALVFLVPNSQLAIKCREELLKIGMSTKILPEAYTWHFAGKWDHMPELVSAHGGDLDSAFKKSEAILSRAVSIPISVKAQIGLPQNIRKALIVALLTNKI